MKIHEQIFREKLPQNLAIERVPSEIIKRCVVMVPRLEIERFGN